jgi:hypothetical protein
MRTTRRFPAASTTVGPEVLEYGIQIEFIRRGFEGKRVQAEGERVQGAQNQTELSGRLSRLQLGQPSTTHTGCHGELGLSLAPVLPGLADCQAEVARADNSHGAPIMCTLMHTITHGNVRAPVCHSLWLFCADPDLLHGRRVTCAHNIVCDVENAGGIVEYDGRKAADLVIDGNLISARHPDVTERFMQTMLAEIRSSATVPT